LEFWEIKSISVLFLKSDNFEEKHNFEKKDRFLRNNFQLTPQGGPADDDDVFKGTVQPNIFIFPQRLKQGQTQVAFE